MMKTIQKLLAISSAGLCDNPPNLSDLRRVCRHSGELAEQLENLLIARNGFLAFESSLLVLPSEPANIFPGILDWNRKNGWRRHYEHVPKNCIFFAQDALACQFGIANEGVLKLEPESGEIAVHSKDLAEWAKIILENYDYETGWSVSKDWQQRNGTLPMGYRLLGKQPFILGGDYVADNLVAVYLPEAMEKLGHLYGQLKDIPDGEKITIEGWIA